MYDSRRDRLNWTQVGFNDSLSAWIMPESLPSPVDPTQNGTLVLQDMPPIRAGSDALHFETTISGEQQEYLHRKEIGEIRGASLANGGIIKPVHDITFDLGQNFAGWCRCKFNGPRGVSVFIRHAEILTQPLMSTNPQRDERLGWMGDAALSVDEALYNFDFIKMFLNFLNLIVDLQLSNGAVPNYVPGYYFPPDPNWGTALPTITWQLYRHYGDVRILETYYDHVRAYVEYIRSDYNSKGLGNLTYLFGDWVPPPPQPMTDQHLTSSFGFLHDVSLLINMSQVLGKTNDTQTYSTLYQHLAEEFHRTFYTSASNFYDDGLQAAQILALALPNVVPMNVRGAVFDHLVADISEKGTHVSTGIIATAQLYPLLSDNGYHDLALELISSVTYPSYGFMFMNPFENATTLWETWSTPYDGPNSVSRNHIMFGSVGAWFYSHLAGIHLSSDMITIRPRMASESKKYLMSKINCQLSTLHGLIHVSYTRDEHDTIIANSILLRVTIPPNTKARVVFEPLFVGARCVILLEGDQVIWSPDTDINTGKIFLVERDSATNLITVYVGSGQYTFKASWY
ncbi:unnamed protein product [Rotaria sordida]|uniref:alpha-L-rhamnosidase n=1 Tax=Rotaria sordida TaxID=392033 RepID=A0A815HZ50_9BILA|nr:unnamed protein product [Rotaria sordida]CAF3908344.1 unnamed protein product [Rotaria sordida]